MGIEDGRIYALSASAERSFYISHRARRSQLVGIAGIFHIGTRTSNRVRL